MPFEEEPADGVFFLDHNYLESMADLFKKVSAKERVVGWYHTGPTLRPLEDMKINEEIFRKYCNVGPVLVVMDPYCDAEVINVDGCVAMSYVAVEEVHAVQPEC